MTLRVEHKVNVLYFVKFSLLTAKWSSSQRKNEQEHSSMFS